MCAGNVVSYHTEVVSESKMVREMLRFTIETVRGGCEGGRCQTAGAAMLAHVRLCSPMVAYGRLWSPMVGSVRHWEVESQAVKRIVMVASRWCWVADGGAVILRNVIAGSRGGAVFLGNVIAGDQTLLGCRWWRGIIGECHCRFPWWRGVIRECHCRWPMVARCYWGMSLQVVKRIVMVASSWWWVADGGGCYEGMQ